MMSKSIREQAITYALRHEGGRSNHAADRGGDTLYGVSSRYWPLWFEHILKENRKSKKKGLEAAREFYRKEIWTMRPFSSLNNQDIANLAFDLHVNHSPRAAGLILQRACNQLINGLSLTPLAEDGVAGPKTMHRLNRLSRSYLHSLIGAICGERYRYYRRLVQSDSTQGAFMRGWAARCYYDD